MRYFLFSLAFWFTSLTAAPFTVASYNCGGLSDHYDYIRGVCMHQLAQQRANEEPEVAAQLQRIESAALRILFAEDQDAYAEWERGGYSDLFARITAHPEAEGSINQKWRALSEAIVTTYKERPVVIHDPEVREVLSEHVQDLTHLDDDLLSSEAIGAARRIMAKRIFAHELKYDIIALQEGNYLDTTLFPSSYSLRLVEGANGVAWNKERFTLVREVGNVVNRGFLTLLKDRTSGQTVLVASGHLTGCNPFEVVEGDSVKGDDELRAILELMEQTEADVKVLAMDSNVTAMHPRLAILKEAGYALDSQKHLEPTCSNPWQVLDTRIDWIAVKSASVSNIPVLGVGLNSPQTNISDHKPVAARIFPDEN